MQAAARPLSVRDGASEREIAAILLGRPVRPADPSTFAYTAVRHHVAALLVHAGVSSLLPREHAQRLADEARRSLVLSELRDRELRRVLARLTDAGTRVLLMKGAHLGHSVYPSPHLRPREDSDLLVRRADIGRVALTLEGLGYTRQHGQTGDRVLGQMMFDSPDRPGATLDIHWRVAAPALAASLFDVEALLARAHPVPRLGAGALGPSPADALAIACVHQAAHHNGHELLLWMYDIHLLLHAMDDMQVQEFVARAASGRMAGICLSVLESVAAWFPSARAAGVVAQLARLASGEPSAALLSPGRPIDALRRDLVTLGSWRERAALVSAHLFPPAAYIRTTYAPGSGSALAWLYVRRIACGARRWVSRTA